VPPDSPLKNSEVHHAIQYGYAWPGIGLNMYLFSAVSIFLVYSRKVVFRASPTCPNTADGESVGLAWQHHEISRSKIGDAFSHSGLRGQDFAVTDAL